MIVDVHAHVLLPSLHAEVVRRAPETVAAAAELAAAGRPPRLAVVVATADVSSAWYVRSIARAAEKTGIACAVVDLPDPDSPTMAVIWPACTWSETPLTAWTSRPPAVA